MIIQKIALTISALSLICAQPSDSGETGGRESSCTSLVGHYEGVMPAGESVTGDEEKFEVIVGIDEISVAKENSSFQATAINATCLNYKLEGIAEVGAGGSGRLSLSIYRDSNYNFRIRIYNYVEGDGPNLSVFFPSDDFTIVLNKLEQ